MSDHAFMPAQAGDPQAMLMGGSIPVVSLFAAHLGAPCVMMGFGLPDDNLHAPNEKMYLPNIYSGIAASAAFLQHLHRY